MQTVGIIAAKYAGVYENIAAQQDKIINIIDDEAVKFERSVEQGLKKFKRLAPAGAISGKEAFDLYQSYGFPAEITLELAAERNIKVDMEGYQAELAAHQAKSREGAEQKFKGGLADHGEMSVKYHTATHLLHKALHMVLGETAHQKGSNITSERLRFDFAHPAKMTTEEIKRTEDIVNEIIQKDLPVTYEDLPKEEAEARGAR